jgi:hypothetical protein
MSKRRQKLSTPGKTHSTTMIRRVAGRLGLDFMVAGVKFANHQLGKSNFRSERAVSSAVAHRRTCRILRSCCGRRCGSHNVIYRICNFPGSDVGNDCG